MAALKDGARANGEVFFALVAAIEAVLAGCDPLAQAALGTFWAIRPEAAFEIESGRLLVGNYLEKFED